MSQQKNSILINEHALNRESVPLKFVPLLAVNFTWNLHNRLNFLYGKGAWLHGYAVTV